MKQNEQIVFHVKKCFVLTYQFITQSMKQILIRLEQSLKQYFGEENICMVKQFFIKNAMGCLFGTFVLGACIFQYRQMKRINKQKIISSDQSKGKIQRQVSIKMPEKLKSKNKFISSDGQNQVQNEKAQYYQSTKQSKKQLKRQRSKKSKQIQNSEDFQRALQLQIGKMQGKQIVLQDSKSDRIFNQMYGMYKQSLE